MKINTISPHTPPIAQLLINWYNLSHRKLPWRETNDPYKIWLSEIILQQTRVAQGLPYYNAFVGSYPDIHSFANADLDSILKLWQGLGYYSRARNMHICANMIVDQYNGRFPCSYKELLKLKGVGKYTAAAIASICFNEPIPVVDGNVYRVFSRIFEISDDISNSKTFNTFYETGESLIDSSNPGTFNQSVMELGALVCTPKNPKCNECTVAEYCASRKNGTQTNFPVKTKKVKVKERHLKYLIIHDGINILIQQRDTKNIWKNLFEFYLEDSMSDIETNQKIFLEAIFKRKTRHILTHQRLNIDFFELKTNFKRLVKLEKDLKMRRIKIEEIHSFAVPKPIEAFLKDWDYC
ncbi:A/G-specific adenine glycosylase [Reichenbachiella versicolor]|uniref:A/G-specific adenine glycosylase n=1 Tax=Reichenbachiella versicolor TaxID=1821036 RepID=UPI001C8731EC|nr:A/G-specific adenine glycosylase [Reichenbachiella versicolor]